MAENILIAVDESDAARKAVEYVGRIFGGKLNVPVEVTLFHVAENMPQSAIPIISDPAVDAIVAKAMKDWAAQAGARCEKLLASYRSLLVKAGIPGEKIRSMWKLDEALPEARRVAAALAIIKEAGEGGYSTVVIGRRGTSNMPEFFLGGVADKVSRHVVGATVWIVD